MTGAVDFSILAAIPSGLGLGLGLGFTCKGQSSEIATTADECQPTSQVGC